MFLLLCVSSGVPRPLLPAGEGPARKRKLRLQFVTKLALPLFTGARVEGEGGSAVLVVLQYADTGHTAMQEEESSLKLEVVVLEGDFNTNDDEDWSEVRGVTGGPNTQLTVCSMGTKCVRGSRGTTKTRAR